MAVHVMPTLGRELSIVFGAMEDGVLVTDPAGRLAYANPSAARMMGLASPGEASGEELERRVELLDTEQQRPFPPERLPERLAREGGAPGPVELLWRRRDTGQGWWLTVTATPITEEDGTLARVVTLLRDVTAHRRGVRAMRFLAEASAALASSLEYGTTLQVLASLAVPALADWCSVESLEPNGDVLQRAVAHVDPEKLELTREIRRRNPLRIDSQTAPAQVLRTGKPTLLPDFPVERLRAIAAQNPADAPLLIALGIRSAINVPLIARGRTLGLLCLYTSESERHFDEEDLAVALELGNRAALAVDNARLFKEARAALERTEEESRLNETLRRLGNAFATELDFERLAQRITGEATLLLGARFGAFLYRDVDGNAGQIQAGEMDEAFQALASAWVPALGAPGTAPDAAVRVDELSAHLELVGLAPARAGCPIRSLLAAPVSSRAGKVLGQLVFGDLRPDAFTPHHEHALLGVAVQAAIALDNARLFQQLRAAQERMRASEERLRMAVSAGRLGYHALDVATRKLELSEHFVAMMGIPSSTFVGAPGHIKRFVHPEDLERAREHLRRMIEGHDENEPFVIRVLHLDGTVHWIESYSKLIRDEEGRPVRVLGIGMDVTERHQAQEKVRRLVEELQRSNAELERFAYVASHDLQEPLRMVASYTQLLARRYRGRLDADADEFIRYTVDGVTRMKRLIQDLLSYSRVGTQAKPLVLVSFREVLGHAMDSVRPAAEEAGAEISTDAAFPEVMGDEVQLEQLLQNLLGNAIKFRGEAPPRIHVGTEWRDSEQVFHVRDNGIGIESQYFERIFIIFQRLHERDAYEGTGIGLAVCKRIVERHGGRIWVESVPGRGCTFYFTLGAPVDQRGAGTTADF